MEIVAEISGNHNGSITRAKKLIELSKNVGATRVKIQTYTPDSITIDSDKAPFIVSSQHKLWGNKKLFDLYQEAHTPYEWHEELFEFAKSICMPIFSTPFDINAVELLEKLEVDMYKVASLETGDFPLLSAIASTKKPLIISTGATKLDEIDELIEFLKKERSGPITLLLCTSAYPTPLNHVSLNRLNLLRSRYKLPVGLSDHTLGMTASVVAAAMGCSIIEKHLTISRSDGGPDSGFSMEPTEFETMVNEIRNVELVLGSEDWCMQPSEMESRRFKKSLYITENVSKGELATNKNVRSIRPSGGLEPKYLDKIIGRRFASDLEKGTPLSDDHVI